MAHSGLADHDHTRKLQEPAWFGQTGNDDQSAWARRLGCYCSISSAIGSLFAHNVTVNHWVIPS